LASDTLEEVHDVEFDETNGSLEEDENLDDVRGTQLVNTIKKIDVGNIRSREVIKVEDDKDQVLSNSNVQASGFHDQNHASHHLKCKINKWLVHHLNQVINPIQVIKCKCSNQPVLQEIIHWTL
jgi:hypothetical protein